MPRPYIPNDKWSRKAAAEGYRARSVYKLIELDERFQLLKPRAVVVDLGAAPGSWLQYVSKMIGPDGVAIGIDRTAIKPIADNVFTHEADITDHYKILDILRQDGVQEADVVLSDSAPNTSGIKDMDQWQSIELARAAFDIAKEVLKPNGLVLVKVFRGADFDKFLADLKHSWHDVRTRSAQASRDRSKEIYVIARKGNYG